MNIESVLKELNINVSVIKVLKQDASDRLYYRVLCDGQEQVLCFDKAINSSKQNFLTLNEPLKRVGLPVPRIFKTFPNFSIYFQEDLGDLSFEKYWNESAKDKIPHSIVKNIITLQNEKEYLESQITYDFLEDKLNFEMEMANNYFLEYFAKRKLSKNENKELCDYLRSYFSSEERLPCHRDYHSKNLLKKDTNFYWIDYQDIFMGPRYYDLVSLLEDCYITYDEKIKLEAIEYYTKESKHSFSQKSYDLTKFQRLFKAMGTFSYQSKEKNNDTYLAYIGKNIANLNSVISKEVFLKNLIGEIVLKP